MGYFSEQHLVNQYAEDWTYCRPELELFYRIEELYNRYAGIVEDQMISDDPGICYTDSQLLYVSAGKIESEKDILSAIEVAEERFREYGLEYSQKWPGEIRAEWVRRVVLQEEPDEFVKVEQDVFLAAS